jgi:hypothetical protein
VFVFYPTLAAEKLAEYLPGFSTLQEGTATAGLKAQFFKSWDDVKNNKVQTSFSENAAIAPSKSPYPVLIFSPGLGVPVLAYTIQLAEIASHGYVIFALDHPYDSAAVKLPSGKLIGLADRHSPKGPPSAAGFRIDAEREAVWVADTQFALREIKKLNSSDKSFRNLLDVSRVGLFGHSMGGRVSVRACQLITDAHACLNEDGGLFGVDFRSGETVQFVAEHTPVHGAMLNIDLPIHAPPGQLDAEGQQMFEVWQARKSKLVQDFLAQNTKTTYAAVDKGTNLTHGSFMDVRFLNAQTERSDPQRHVEELNAINEINVAFFDATLKNNSDKLQKLFARGISGLSFERLR